MVDVVPVDRAPALSGWARAWTHVAVIIFYAAGAASVAPKGSTDCPLMRVSEATAPATTSPTILYDVAPAVISGGLLTGNFFALFVDRSTNKREQVRSCQLLKEVIISRKRLRRGRKCADGLARGARGKPRGGSYSK